MSGPFGVLVNGAGNGNLRFVSGVLNFDGKCGITGQVSTSIDGAVSLFIPATGTYTQNADKTFTITLTPQGSSQETFAVAYSSTALEALGIEQDPPDYAVTASIDLQAQVVQTTVTSTSTTTTPCPIPLLCILNPPKTTTTTTTVPAPALTYNSGTLNATFAASCFSAFGSTDLNYVTFVGSASSATGTINASTSEDYFNNSGSAAASLYSGSYAVLGNGIFGGSANVTGNIFSFVGVIDNQQTEIQYFYFTSSGGVTACTGKKV